MSQKYTWGVPSTTSGWQNYPNGWVYTNGIAMPTPRVDWYGNRPIRIHSFGDYYVTGAGSYMRLNYFNNLVDAGGIMVVNTIGGTFQWEAHQGNISNQMFFGRDRGAGRQVRSINDGFTWDGTLAGSFWWDEVPTEPPVTLIAVNRSLQVHVFAPGSDGGTGIDQYAVQIEKDGGGWYDTRYGGSTQYDNLAPGNYRARAWCHNAVGYSQPYVTGYVTIKAGGKRWDGASWMDLTTRKRWDGAGWVDLSIMKRWNGSAWVDLT